MKTLKEFLNIYFSEDSAKYYTFKSGMHDVHKRQNSAIFINETPVDLLFAGDSIIEGFNMQMYFNQFGMLVNRGVGGEKIIDIVNRWDLDVTHLKPKVCFLCGGVNDLDYFNSDNIKAGVTLTIEIFDKFTDSLMPYYQKAIDKCKENGTKLIIGSATPLGVVDIRTDAIIMLNKKIKALCEKNDIPFVDTFSKLTKQDGVTLIDCTNGDMIHLLGTAYNIYAEALMPYLRKAFNK